MITFTISEPMGGGGHAGTQKKKRIRPKDTWKLSAKKVNTSAERKTINLVKKKKEKRQNETPPRMKSSNAGKDFSLEKGINERRDRLSGKRGGG